MFYLLGIHAALVKFAIISHDHRYPRRTNPNQQEFDIAKSILDKHEVDKVWNHFNTLESPGSPSGFASESPLSIL